MPIGLIANQPSQRNPFQFRADRPIDPLDQRDRLDLPFSAAKPLLQQSACGTPAQKSDYDFYYFQQSIILTLRYALDKPFSVWRYHDLLLSTRHGDHYARTKTRIPFRRQRRDRK